MSSRATGSWHQTGSGAIMAATRLPSAPRSTSWRTLTGTIALSSRPSVFWPRRRRCLPSAPATVASTTSLTVPPSASLIALMSRRSARTQVKRRCGPMSLLYGLEGAGLNPAQAMAPTPTAASRAPERTRRGPRRMARTDRVISAGIVARSSSASASSCERLGSGRGSQRSPRSAGAAGSREVSKRTDRMSTPETPSTSAWWVFESTAKRSSSRPSTSQTSQSGLSRSSCWESTRPARSLSWSSDPGEGRAVERTW